jgi:hypothetical protein
MRAKDWKVRVQSLAMMIDLIRSLSQDHIILRPYRTFDTVIGGAYSVSCWNY